MVWVKNWKHHEGTINTHAFIYFCFRCPNLQECEILQGNLRLNKIIIVFLSSEKVPGGDAASRDAFSETFYHPAFVSSKQSHL